MKKMIACIVMLLAFSQLLHAQSSMVIKGSVLDDSSGTPLSDVSVIHTSTKRGTKTNSSGAFTLTIPAANNLTLSISSVGYVTQTVTVTSANAGSVSVRLRRDVTQAAEDVVVVGYQTVRRKDVLASVASVSARDLKDIPINNAAEALNGRLAGVTATTSEGSPDAEVRVRVRGGMSITQDNSPLYIIDGVQVENGLNSISPQDIQTIDVLKDAAATAIYGARGANGVIVITTKSGRKGKLRVSYNALYGIKRLAKKLDVLKPYDYIVHSYERSQGNSTDSSRFAQDFGTTFDTLSVYKNYPFVDWQEEVMNQPAHLMTHNISVGGGTNKATYNFSYTYNDDKAIVMNSRYKRHLFNLKGDYDITKKIKVGAGVRYTTTDVLGAGVSTESSGSSFARLRNAVKYRPFLSTGQAINGDDPYSPDNVSNGLSLVNPVALADAEYRNKKTDAINITAHGTYKITKKLTFKSTFGYDYNKQLDNQFYDAIAPIAVSQSGSKPMVVLDTTIRKVITNSNVLTYNLDNIFKGHDLNVLVGQETYQLELSRDGRSLRDYPLGTSKDSAFNHQEAGTLIGLNRYYRSKYTNVSFFSNIRYSIRDKYLFSFNVRADGASKFKPGMQWGYFPSASFAWRVKKEKFLQDVAFINDLKFRVGFGAVGNNRIDDYLFLTKFNANSLYYGLNGQTVPAYTSTSLVNENLQWESTVNRNFGVDVSLLKNRLSFSLDYFYNTSKDLLLKVPIAATFGYDEQLQNVGATSNRGFELQLNASILRKKNNLTWNASFNMSTYKTKVEELGYQNYFYPDRSWGITGQPEDYIVRVGDPVGSMWGWVTDGMYTLDHFTLDATGVFRLKPGVPSMFAIAGGSQPGQVKFKDLNGDGIINTLDRTIIGNATPKLTGGLNNQFTYKNWDMSLFINFSFGNDVLNANKIEFSTAYSNNANVLDIANDRWRTIDANGVVIQRQVTEKNAAGQNEFYASTTNLAALQQINANASMWWMPYTAQNAFYPHSWAVEDGSFVRINNVTIGYTLPEKLTRKLKLRFYFTGNNLAVFTKYTGYDPEVSVRNSGLTPGLDYSAYPKSRSYIFGLNLSF